MQNQQGHPVEAQSIVIAGLTGALTVPAMPCGMVVFADGTWDREIAQAVCAHGFAALMLDLLREGEQATRRDVPLLAERLVGAIEALRHDERLGFLPVGIFGTGLSAAAALVASTRVPVSAVVARAGRVDLCDAVLSSVQCPTLLLVCAADSELMDLYHRAVRVMAAPAHIHVIANAGAVHEIAAAATAWFGRHVGTPPQPATQPRT